MSRTVRLKKLALCSASTAILLAASQGVFAHTRLYTSVVPENTKLMNYVNIGHGCPPATARKATFGTSVVFPNAVGYTPIIGIDSTSDGKGTAKVNSAIQAKDLYSPLSGIGTLVRATSPWPYSNNKLDALGNKSGFWAGGIAYDQADSTAIPVAFYSAAVKIVPASCARSVTFMLAIADICDTGAKSPNIGDEQALFWSPIPNFTGVPGQPFGAGVADATRNIPVGPKFSNYDGWGNGDKVGMGAATATAGDGWGSPATLKVTRDLVTNPLPASCTGNGGKGDDVYVYPSAEQINKDLPVWSKANQTGDRYWY